MINVKQSSDEELMEDAKNGNMDSFKELYERYKTKVYRFVYHWVENKESAEDCTHDVFIHLYKMAGHYAPTSKFSSWLYKMAKNMALDTLRKLRVRKTVSLDAQVSGYEDNVTLVDLLTSPEISPQQAVESAEVIDRIRIGISKLNEKDKQVIMLCDMERLSHQEVGDILGCSAETVTVKLFRARQRLAKILKIEELL